MALLLLRVIVIGRVCDVRCGSGDGVRRCSTVAPTDECGARHSEEGTWFCAFYPDRPIDVDHCAACVDGYLREPISVASEIDTSSGCNWCQIDSRSVA